MYPLTEMRKPGPISNGIEEKSALFATAFELMDDSNEASSEMPSLVEVAVVEPDIGAGASGSVGIAL